MKTLIKILCLSVLSFVVANDYSEDEEPGNLYINFMINEYDSHMDFGASYRPNMKSGEYIKLSGFYMSYIYDSVMGGEDYSSTLGPNGFPGDSYLGEKNSVFMIGGGAYFYTPILKNKKFYLQHSVGAFLFSENFHNTYYDSFQILGNNGYYYTEGYSKSNRYFALEIGSSICVQLFNFRWDNYSPSYPIFLNVGYMVNTIGFPSFKIGFGVGMY